VNARGIFRALLRLLPPGLRGRFQDEMEATFADRLADTRARGVGATASLWIRTVLDLAVAAVIEWPRTLARDVFRGDVRLALRGLRKRPVFATIAVGTAALGIGANTAVFSVVQGVLLDPLPVRDPGRLVRIFTSNAPDIDHYFVSPVNYLAMREGVRSFQGLGGWFRNEVTILPEGGDPRRVPGLLVTQDLFRTLGIQPILGRSFLPQDATPGGSPPGLILSYGMWQGLFGGDPDVLQRTVTLTGGGTPVEVPVLGVMPAGLDLPVPDVQLYLPLRGLSNSPARFDRFLSVVGRLSPGVTQTAAAAELTSFGRALSQQNPERNEGWVYGIEPLQQTVVGDARPALLVLLAAAGLVLLVTCTNLGSMLLGRADERRREMALRTALGAEGRRVLRQLLTESLVLALLGGVLGVGLAVLSLDAIRALAATQLPRMGNVGLNAEVLAFTLGITLLTGVLFGLAPALRLTKVRMASVLREKGGTATPAGGRRERLRRSFVVSQLAASVVLVVSAVLLTRSFSNLVRSNPGFDPTGVVSAELTLGPAYPELTGEVTTFWEQLRQAATAIPGVEAVGLASTVPLGPQWDYPAPLEVVGRPPVRAGDRQTFVFRQVDEGFLDAVGGSMVAGRWVGPSDRANAPGAVVLNRSAARILFPGEKAVGQELSIPIRVFGTLGEMLAERVRVVGVVGDMQYRTLTMAAEPSVYFGFRQAPFRKMSVLLRTSDGSSTAAAVAALRRAIVALNPTLAVSRVGTLRERITESLARERLSVVLLGAFAVLALILAVVGVYGVVSQEVARRSGEIGLRMALGARRSEVAQLVLLRVASLMGLGLGAGLVLTLVAGRFLGSQLYGVRPADPVTLTSVMVILSLACLLGAATPTRRALAADPATTLRQD
jgi:putative ABC transport system permease protein